ncbi:(d)CMP kinase [Rickettsiales endosymbiont of Trichoplax sp. H2]|uniref:(d)CMP kinase n=1 Tax=Rickettsiales endosymbiont of Trichoplax sp. H2 TaxID=2021221 RepID=UPI0012B33E47|nr:(d)CMP kinase [Rickettsiales endosymbiont of Trichoplax sp. H2]MSO13476.1 Cytidylate kinase 1 [Rickettsiales endosymbiont of Trichoplax sp. H2]
MNKKSKSIIIAFDGTAASGKGTVAKSLAEKLRYDYLDTGLMFRKVAYFSIKNKVNLSNIEKICELIYRIDFAKPIPLSEIYSDEVSDLSSKIAEFNIIREKLLNIQREFAKGKNGIVVDGRDIGTVVFPNADFKFFFDANIEERARRRYKQLQKMGKSIKLQKVLEYLKIRDKRDIERKSAPLLKADDSMLIDTTQMTIEESLNIILNKLKFK